MLSPRGRPPKKAKVEEAPSTYVPVKRGRGRPPPQGEALRTCCCWGAIESEPWLFSILL
jgi:hypothetical protein